MIPLINLKDKDGISLNKGDWITDESGRNFQIMQEPRGVLIYIKSDDGKPFPEWLFPASKIQQTMIKNPILSPYETT